MKYGVFLGRFQPFHIGHESVIHEIISDGLEPIVLIGSVNVTNEKNPYSYIDRATMISKVFPGIKTIPLHDESTNEKWFAGLLDILSFAGIDSTNAIIYYNHKECDKTNFVYKKKIYHDAHYSAIFSLYGFTVKQPDFSKKLNLNINATDIRKDLDAHKHLLDSRIYRYLKCI